MKLKKASSVDYVHQFSDMTFMKFKPTQQNLKRQQQKPQQQNTIFSRIKSILPWQNKQSTTSSRASQVSALQKSSSQVSIKSISLMTDEPGLSIIFLEKITPEHFLIGNENQLDLIFIGGIVGNFIDTETLWELNIGRPIKNLAIDTKKGNIAIETNTEICIYQYDNKQVRKKAALLTSIKTESEGKYVRFVRDSVLAVFYKNIIEIYVIEEDKMRRKMRKQIKQAADKELFQVPLAVQNSLNVFYIKRSQTCKTFELWYVQMNLKGIDVEMTDLMKVYDIKEGLETKIKLENFSKQIFLMNLGFEILAVKKGYIIDSAYLNIQEESTFLHYIGNNRLLHLSPMKAEIYRFKINFNTNPPRIDIASLDSIEVKKPGNYQYIGALQMFDRNFAVFYQIVPHHNRRVKGQITYCFAITRHVTVEQKIREIFTFEPGKPLKDVSLELIEERVDMARKIGLNRTQIYLQLWNRTNKTEVEEFKFLLDTLSYETIRIEIEKKMKKSSMLWREVYKIQQSCFEMIKDNLFSSRCNEQVAKQFLTSHFLLRKLELYRDISLAQKKSNKNQGQSQQGDALKLNIQNYNKYSKADIKTLFLQLIHEYCLQEKDVLMHIRIFLKSFRFIFRIIYRQLLQDIVSTTKSSLIKLLENFPELLPFNHILKEDDDPALYEGVWKEINRLEWEKNLHIEAISTIDNRQVIAQIPKSLWFRRNFLTLHDMTEKSKQQILKINKSNSSDEIFYFFISKVFEYVQQEEPLNKIISFVQKNYERMPAHLQQRIFLYRKIYLYFKEKNVAKEKLRNFHDLLEMKDYELFKEFFEVQKVEKGCLLKDIKKIYEQVGGSEQVFFSSSQLLDDEGEEFEVRRNKLLARGTAWFNEGMLSYFNSNLSEISDLKYILNRINNAKLQFFAQNQHLIYVLVKSVQLKLKVGSDNDVPISEILLYLQNIPLNYNSPVLQQLQRIQKINEQVERFQQIKINMTISEIIKNCENVINALINRQIKKRRVMEVESMEEMRELSYDILAEIQVIKEKIYSLEYSDLTFFVYLTKIMQEVHMIPYAAQLLQDPFLKQHYSIKDLKVVQDLILYMYKMKLSQNPKYIQNQYYLTNLLQILPEDNQCRIYIHCQLQYAKILSAPNNPVEYPITDKMDGITIVQLEERIQQLPGEFLLKINIQKLHRLMNTMQQICYEDMEAGLCTSINQIYQIIILKLIQDNKIVDSLPLVKRLLMLPNNQYEAIFPLFYIDLISQELTVQCKKNLLKAVSFLYNEPLQLLSIVEQLIGKVFSTNQRNQYFRDLAEKSQKLRKNYNPKNPILDPIYLELIRNDQMQTNFKNMIDQCSHHLVKTKEEFNSFEFSLLFIILTQHPYSLGKYIFCKRYSINYKVMRSFLSYVIKEEIFSSIKVLEFGRRLFNIVLQASQSFLPFESIASQYANVSMDEHVEFEELLPLEPILLTDDEFVKKAKMLESKLQKCIMAFDRKKASVTEDLRTNGPSQNIDKKKARFQRQLTNPMDLSQKAPSQYPFVDSDDDYGQEQKFDDFTKSIRKKKIQKEFNPSVERNLLMNRTTKNYALFMSTSNNQKPDPMYMSSRAVPHKKLIQTTKNYAVDGSSSLRLSVDEPFGRIEHQYSKRSAEQMHDELGVGLTESVDGKFGVTRSAVFKKRRSANLGEEGHSPMFQPSQEESVEVSEEEQGPHSHRPVSHQVQYAPRPIVQSTQALQQQPSQTRQSFTLPFNPLTQAHFQVHIQQIDADAFMPPKKMSHFIIQSISQQSEQFYVDLSALSKEQEKDLKLFPQYMLKVIGEIYNDQSVKAKTRLRVVKEIDGLYPDLGINKDYLEVYVRFQSYHAKYDIAIPITDMFPVQFLFSPSKDLKQLFDQVATKIVELVDDSNIYKISKIIHLAFKASSFEQEFFFSYLCMAAEKFDTASISANELSMQLQKLTALIEKLPVHIITERGFKMVDKMVNNERRQKIVQAMVNCVKKKKSPEEVARFQQSLAKYVQ